MDHLKIKISKKDMMAFISCVFVLTPALFSSLSSVLGGSLGRYLFYFLAFIIAGAVEGVGISNWQLKVAVPWIVILLICILNRNGDLERGTLSSIINMIAILSFSVIFIVKSDCFMKNALRAMVVCLCVELVGGFYLWLKPSVMLRLGTSVFKLQSGTYFYRQFTSQVNAGAFMSIASHYSTSGMYMALGVILLAAYMFAYRQYYSKWNMRNVVGFAVFFFALILTQKRAHLLFVTIAILAMYLIGYVQGNIRRRLGQILGIVIVLSLAFILLMQTQAFQTVISRFFAADTLDVMSSGRVSNLWTPAWNEFLQHPFLGIGWRQFKYLHPMSNGTVNNDAHNIYLQLISENGIFLGGFIIIFIIKTFTDTWGLLNQIKKKKQWDNAYTFLMFSFGYQTFFILYGLTGNPLYDIECFFPYVICCCISYRYKYKRVNPVAARPAQKGEKSRPWINAKTSY